MKGHKRESRVDQRRDQPLPYRRSPKVGSVFPSNDSEKCSNPEHWRANFQTDHLQHFVVPLGIYNLSSIKGRVGAAALPSSFLIIGNKFADDRLHSNKPNRDSSLEQW